MILFAAFILFAISAGLSYFLAPMFISTAHRLHFLDIPHDRKSHAKPTPYTGGIGIFLVFWLMNLAVMWVVKSGWIRLGPFTESIIEQIPGVFFGGIIIFVLGFLDDRFDLPAIVKFVGQSAAALILMHFGAKVNLLANLGILGYFVTFIWIVSIINAFNFIDSIDAHCAGVAFISAIVLFVIANIIYQPVLALLTAVLAGALMGYLPFNWKPARTFLGDNGSMFLGYLMAALTLICTYRSQNTQYSVITPFIPILLFGVPLYDTLSVIVVRVFRGIPPWKGDRNHFAHRLVRLGMNEQIACAVSYFIVFTLGLVAILSTQVHSTLGKLVIVLLFASVIGIIALLEYYAATRIRMMEQIGEAQQRRRKEDGTS